MKNTRPTHEFCSIRFERQHYDKSKADKPMHKTIFISRYLENGRLGAALATYEDEPKMFVQAKECSKVGPIVGDHFFTNPPVRAHRAVCKTELPVSSWFKELESKMEHRFYESNCVIQSTRRTVDLKQNDQPLVHTEILYLQYLFSLREEKGGNSLQFSVSSVNDLLPIDSFLADYACLLSNTSGVPIDSQNYEILFSPKAFDVLLDILFFRLNPKLHHLNNALYTKANKNDCIAPTSLTIDQTAKGKLIVDDEGVPMIDRPLIANGHLTGHFNDRVCSQKYDEEPTGNGFRNLQMHSHLREGLPSPQYPFAKVHPGTVQMSEFIRNMKKGVILEEISRTYNQDFLIAPLRIPILRAWLVADGKIVGHARNSPILYLDLQNFSQIPLTFSNHGTQVQGREIPWAYAPSLTIVNQ